MKSGSANLGMLCSLAALALAVAWGFERRACSRLEQGNRALRQQLAPQAQLVAEYQRLSNLLAQANSSPDRPHPEPQTPAPTEPEELRRLRAEAEALRPQIKALEALREDTRQVQAVLAGRRQPASPSAGASTANGSSAPAAPLEIVRAEYWTDNSRMDVTSELRDRIRGDKLKAVASNNLKGDPEYGHPKRLTVEYRVGGVTLTNEFREGDMVILPRD